MSYLKNDALAKQLQRRYDALKEVHTVGDPPITRTIAKELATRDGRSESAAYQTVCYYLRGGNKTNSGVDARRNYTSKELANLEVMSTSERAEYARRTSRSPRAIDAALSRYRKMMLADLRDANNVNMIREIIADNNHYDFGSPVHLKIRGATAHQVVAARNILANPFNLSLRAPNILYHAPTHRRFYLSSLQQDSLLKDPHLFLRICSDLISRGWVVDDTDPITDAAMRVVDGEAAPMPKRRLGRNREVKELHRLSERMQFLIEKQLRDPVIQEGLPLHKSLTTLKIWLDRALELAHPKDFYVDDVGPGSIRPKDLSDYLVIDSHYTCTRCTVRVSPETKICPTCHSDKDVVKVNELESNEEMKNRITREQKMLSEPDLNDQPGDDDWMKDFKPRSASEPELTE